MRALVIYESMFGNTHEIAASIAKGLGTAGLDVDVRPVGAVTEDEVRAAGLVVVGGPTHVHGMARPSTRQAAVEQAHERSLELDDDPRASGLREWFDALPAMPPLAAAAFDTRVDSAKVLTGQASHGIASRLRRHGFALVSPPESFLVDKTPALVPGEEARAEAWGTHLAELSVVPSAVRPDGT
jgi:hypothetical protein